MKIRQNRQSRETGAVSLFVVMFTAMLFAAVTVGFTVLMLSDQQQSTDNDLAQSALDSANAGAEDAKRVLVQYTDCVERGMTAEPECAPVMNAIRAGECDTINTATSGSPGERLVRTSEGGNDSALQQAYTCVKITPNTESYIGKTRSEGDIRLVPLRAVDDTVRRVKVEWLAPGDLAGIDDIEHATDGANLTHSSRSGAGAQPGQAIDLPDREKWRDDKMGAMLRVGSIQYSPGAVNLQEIDERARAVFLYPNSVPAGVSVESLVNLEMDDLHLPLTTLTAPANTEPNHPHPSTCRKDSTLPYLCETTLELPLPLPGEPEPLRYLTIASLYRDASFRITLYGDSPSPDTLVKFRNVQPEIDVTGRANDVFRRIVSRVESADASEAPYPRAALGVVGDICKNYIITDDPDEYKYLGSDECLTRVKINNPDALIVAP